MNKITGILFFSFCLVVSVGTAQVNDAGLWASINLEKRFSKKIGVSLSQEFRLNENISELGTYFSEIAAEYKINKYFEISAGYRFIQKRRVTDFYSTRHRFLVNVVSRKKFGNLNTALRLRYQSQYSDIRSSDDGSIPQNYLRTKLTFKYDLNKRYNPVLSGETYFHANNPDGILVDGYRIAVGIEYDFSKKSSVEVGYLFDREINVNNPWTNYIIALSWNYRL